jgi:hypothetical protein
MNSAIWVLIENIPQKFEITINRLRIKSAKVSRRSINHSNQMSGVSMVSQLMFYLPNLVSLQLFTQIKYHLLVGILVKMLALLVNVAVLIIVRTRIHRKEAYPSQFYW